MLYALARREFIGKTLYASPMVQVQYAAVGSAGRCA
jgi:hypothetical protein